MTTNTDPQPQAKDLDLAKLCADDEQEWTIATKILFTRAKAAAKAAVSSRTDSELISLAHQSLAEVKKKFLGFIEKGRPAEALPNWVATIAYRRSIDLLRKDTGAHRNAADESLEDALFRESAEEFYENSKILEAEDNPFLDAEQFESSSCHALLERTYRRTGALLA